MFTIQELSLSSVFEYEKFTEPVYRPMLHEWGTNESVLACSASFLGQPAGLLLIELQGGIGNVKNLFVTPRFRRMGAGTKLIQYAERILSENGLRLVEIGFISSRSWVPAMIRLLRKCGWTEPRVQTKVFCIARTPIAQAKWLERYRLPSSYSTSGWESISQDERKNLIDGKNKWYPGYLFPFDDDRYGQRYYPSSLLLRLQGEIVGWVSARQVASDTVLYGGVFVREELQHLGRGVQLLAEAVRVHLCDNMEYAIFAVSVDNHFMESLVNRMFLPYTKNIEESIFSDKDLVKR